MQIKIKKKEIPQKNAKNKENKQIMINKQMKKINDLNNKKII